MEIAGMGFLLALMTACGFAFGYMLHDVMAWRHEEQMKKEQLEHERIVAERDYIQKLARIERFIEQPNGHRPH